jgi:hypothetical protein
VCTSSSVACRVVVLVVIVVPMEVQAHWVMWTLPLEVEEVYVSLVVMQHGDRFLVCEATTRKGSTDIDFVDDHYFATRDDARQDFVACATKFKHSFAERIDDQVTTYHVQNV